jgi:uncharacterized SAM-binding protein YcdF (DUF218 family)
VTAIGVHVGSKPYGLGQVLWDYLRSTDRMPLCPPGSPSDTVIMVLGSPDTAIAGHAADLLKRRVADIAVVSGGCPITVTAPQRIEADVIADNMEQHGASAECVLREPLSQNTSEHFWKTETLLKNRSSLFGGQNPPKFVVLVPTPTAEQRALATGRKRWPDSQLWVDGIPETYDQHMNRMDRAAVLGRMVGEVERIITYPGLEYMTEPEKSLTRPVRDAYQELRRDFNTRPIPEHYQLIDQVTA